MSCRPCWLPLLRVAFVVLVAGLVRVSAAEESVASPDGRITLTLNDQDGLRYEVQFAGRTVLTSSRLGLDLEGGLSLGRQVTLLGATRSDHDSFWENAFGQRRLVRDHFREMRVALQEKGDVPGLFNLIVRIYDQGVAFRYEIPRQPGLDEFVILEERTEFVFPDNFPCYAGDHSDCAENQYPRKRLTDLLPDSHRPHVLPLLVEMPQVYAFIAEADLLDWGGMFLSALSPTADGQRRPGAKVALASRKDGRGKVVGRDRRLSPWRVLILTPDARELVASDLIPTLSTPSQIADTSWIKPGITAWDAWWTGVNPSQPDFKGLNSRGDTRSHREYIDFAGEMGFAYQLVDWFWYEPMNHPKADLTKPAAHVDLPALLEHAKQRGVRLLLWLDSHDLERQGIDPVLQRIADWGFAGVKVDFMNHDGQETVQWYAKVLASAARHRLVVDFHGAYKPTGLARTWPNYLTQEGVLGNEYHKIRTDACTTQHTITLPFTRGPLGPMDFTPGGFRNRTAADFKLTAPAEVIGSRARQLAMTVVYFSPLLCLCDSPESYRGQPGVEFFRGLPTVWDETVVLAAEVAHQVVVARRAGEQWYVGAMNGDTALTLQVPLRFLGEGTWELRAFADTPETSLQPEKLSETTRLVGPHDSIELKLAEAGGYAARLVRRPGTTRP